MIATISHAAFLSSARRIIWVIIESHSLGGGPPQGTSLDIETSCLLPSWEKVPEGRMRGPLPGARTSLLHRPALQREQSPRTPLDEQYDQHQDQDLRDHRPRIGFEE